MSLTTAKAISRALERATTGKKLAVDFGCGHSPYASSIKCKCFRIDRLKAVKPDLVADLDKPIKLQSGCADVAISLNVVNYLKNKKQFLAEVHRILKPKGLFVVSCMNFYAPHDHPYDTMSVFSLWKLLRGAGFKVKPVDLVHSGIGGTVILLGEKRG